ncbi:hypothetical protein N7658_14495 [Pseudomonas aeruginosa]|nr:hypothetical protein [Pseudomonas aeruginosa]MDG9819202.1 hypothetical protein [Pseudomonas aeruginosa]MDG9933770.1 hypothetical protein [Pseudomonas aeruginosa]MDH0529929.1 hypothetical protein [Pseudomonas aeruginosa]MDH0534359.1 hypothetical protein [Pseudomonas aeruginosa]HDQ4606363.1 hypothetical protein [Pseudomonas aeruginosa]
MNCQAGPPIVGGAAVDDGIGFDEPNNFVQFFKREVGQVPGAFRREQRGGRTPALPQRTERT